MKAKFTIDKSWKTNEGLNALAERKVQTGNNLSRAIACLTYPTIQFIYEAWLNSGDEPECVEEDDEFNGKINFSIFVVLKGNTPTDRPELADDETGLMWESHEFINDIVIKDIDFTSEKWESELETEMIRVAELYIKNKNFSFNKANF